MTAGEKWRPGSHFLLHSGLSSASERRAESQSGEGGKATMCSLETWLSNFKSHRLQEEERWGESHLGSLVSSDDKSEGQSQTAEIPWSRHEDT